MLTAEHRAELDERGAMNVRSKLTSYGGGHNSTLDGFLRAGSPLRGDVESWLAEQSKLEAAQQHAAQSEILRWAKIAAWAGIVGAILTAVAIGATIWPFISGIK
jgi:hypothetical protein